MVTQTQLKELFTYNASTGIFTRRVVRANKLIQRLIKEKREQK